jgi:chromosome segregation ATPase
LVEENGSLNGFILDQVANVRMQSAVITSLEGQLGDQGRVLLQAARLGEQHKREAQVSRKEVERLKERMAALTTESDRVQSMFTVNLQSAEIREGQLRDSLDAAAGREVRLRDTLRSNEMLLVQVQAALRTAEDTGRAQQQTLTLELETCAMQRELWKTTAEQAELRLVAADRSMLDLRKELAVAFRNARSAKEQLESQTAITDERDAAIRSLNRELTEVREQLQDADDQIDNMQPDFEHTDAWKPCDSDDQTDNPQPDFEHIDAWKPCDFKDQVNNPQPDFEHIEAWKPLGSRFNDGPPPVLEWRGWLTRDEPKVPTPATQERSRQPDISIVELCSDGSTRIQAAATLPDEPLSCSSTPVIRSAPFDDPFVVDSPLKPRPTNPTFAILSLAGSPITPESPLGRPEIIEDLQEQLAQEQLARVDAEYQLNLQHLKVLATEAVVVVQHRHLTDQQSQLSEETAKNASLYEEIRNLNVENGAMTTRIAQSDANLAECQTARIAADKAAANSLAELAKVKAMLPALVKEADDLKKEVADLLNLQVEHGAMIVRAALLEASLTESQTARMAATKDAGDTHSELVKVKETLSVLTTEANGLRNEARELKKEADRLKKERDDLDMRLSQAMLLSSALQVRVQDLEQKGANVSSTPSDGLFELFIPFFVCRSLT